MQKLRKTLTDSARPTERVSAGERSRREDRIQSAGRRTAPAPC